MGGFNQIKIHHDELRNDYKGICVGLAVSDKSGKIGNTIDYDTAIVQYSLFNRKERIYKVFIQVTVNKERESVHAEFQLGTGSNDEFESIEDYHELLNVHHQNTVNLIKQCFLIEKANAKELHDLIEKN